MPLLLEVSGYCKISAASGHVLGGHFFPWQKESWETLTVSGVLKGRRAAPLSRSHVNQTLTAGPAHIKFLPSPPQDILLCCLLPGSPVPITKHKGLFSMLSETCGHKKSAAWRQGGGSWRPWDYQSPGMPEEARSLPQLLKGQEAMEWLMCLVSLPCHSLSRQTFCTWIPSHQDLPSAQAGPT